MELEAIMQKKEEVFNKYFCWIFGINTGDPVIS